MDNKLKLNARCNWWNLVVSFWIGVAKLLNRMHSNALDLATHAQDTVFDILREMLDEDYDEDYKEQIREVINMRNEL